MDNYAIETVGLTKRYGGLTAVSKVDLLVKKGDIYGFVGRNGAGKTTLIKMLMGLTAPDEGQIRLLGKDKTALTEERKRIGCLIEAPALSPNLSAFENLEVYRMVRGIADKNTVKEVLSAVGLDCSDPKRAKFLSQGNKQRLGLAIALLGNPDMLILDEPINGLDPTGMQEIREYLEKLNRERGATILISSHILGELSKIAHSYGIINSGVLVEQISATELIKKRTPAIKLVCDDTFKAVGVLENILNTKNYKIKNGSIFVYDFVNDPTSVNKALVMNDVLVKEFSVGGDDLEGYFLSLMEDKK